jgi:histidinol dehydrogenase
VIEYSQSAMQAVAGDVATMANKEGLTAHRRSVDIRVESE